MIEKSSSREDPIDVDLGATASTESMLVQARPKGVPVGRLVSGVAEIFIDSDVRRNVWEHVRSNRRVELGGVLLGNSYDDSGEFIRVTSSLDARYTATDLASLTFTHETWSDLSERIGSEHSDEKIVGWYHSHPGHGIFMSSFDRFIHENFFRSIHQCAWVLDPVRNTEGLFQWSSDRLVASGYNAVGNAPIPLVIESSEVAPDLSQPQCTRTGAFHHVLQEAEKQVIEALSRTPESLLDALKTYGLMGNVKIVRSIPGKRFSGEG